MNRKLTAGAAAATLAFTLSACGGGSSTDAPADPNAVVNVATRQTPSSLDPCAGNSGYDLTYLKLLYAPLIDIDPATLKPLPGIASSWEFAGPEKLTFTVKIRPGMTFHDGTPVDADAVKASMQHCLGTGLVPVPSITGIDVVSADTVSIRLNKPTSGMPGYLSSRLGFIVSPTALKQHGDNFANHPVGAGPYEFTRAVPNSEYSFARFAGYRPVSDPAPKAAGIDIKIVTSDTAMTNALTSGTADYAFGIGESATPPLERNPDITLERTPQLGFTAIVINTKNSPVNNPKVRLAMEYALDRKAIANAVLNSNTGTPAWSLYPPGTTFHDPQSDNAWPYNPDKARQLLAEAGYPNGLTIRGISAALPPFSTNAVVVSEQWKKVGIDVNFVNVPGAQAISQFVAHNAAELFSVGWPSQWSAPLNYSALLGPTSYYRQNAEPNPDITRLIDKLNDTYTDAEQLAVVKEINRIVVAQAEFIPLYHAPAVAAYTRRVKGVVPSLNGSPELVYLAVS
ncbi:ABC transporter substrate-binding protein [Nocardia sp. NPDC050710]|uniref:ABC transporter substrate-binding protein n=1 Tax=Nocardia sp. NPDC050710 TaxID=3157220 RepID=UPI0033DBFD58